MKGYTQVLIPALTAFTVTALFLVVLSTQGSFDISITSSQKENLDSYQSRLNIHTIVQNKTILNKMANYSLTENSEARKIATKEMKEILGDNNSENSYRFSFKRQGTINSGNNITLTNDNGFSLSYSRIIVPSPKKQAYELEVGSKVQ